MFSLKKFIRFGYVKSLNTIKPISTEIFFEFLLSYWISTVTPVSSGISTIETTRTMVVGVRVGTAVTFSITGDTFTVSARSGNVSIDV